MYDTDVNLCPHIYAITDFCLFLESMRDYSYDFLPHDCCQIHLYYAPNPNSYWLSSICCTCPQKVVMVMGTCFGDEDHIKRWYELTDGAFWQGQWSGAVGISGMSKLSKWGGWLTDAQNTHQTCCESPEHGLWCCEASRPRHCSPVGLRLNKLPQAQVHIVSTCQVQTTALCSLSPFVTLVPPALRRVIWAFNDVFPHNTAINSGTVSMTISAWIKRLEWELAYLWTNQFQRPMSLPSMASWSLPPSVASQHQPSSNPIQANHPLSALSSMGIGMSLLALTNVVPRLLMWRSKEQVISPWRLYQESVISSPTSFVLMAQLCQ